MYSIWRRRICWRCEALGEKTKLIFNIGSGHGFSVREVIETARRITGHAIPAIESPRRPGDPAVLVASSEKIRSELKWKPQHAGLEDIIGSAWEWHRKHPRGYRELVSHPALSLRKRTGHPLIVLSSSQRTKTCAQSRFDESKVAETDCMANSSLRTTCCIVGGGPAGVMLGYLLARKGVEVTVLEKHKDFFRDFRGDTVHPSTLELMYELGLLQQFLRVPHEELTIRWRRCRRFQIQSRRFSLCSVALQVCCVNAAVGFSGLPHCAGKEIQNLRSADAARSD